MFFVYGIVFKCLKNNFYPLNMGKIAELKQAIK